MFFVLPTPLRGDTQTLNYSMQGGKLMLTYDGVLEESDDCQTWTIVLGAKSPYQVVYRGKTPRYFRAVNSMVVQLPNGVPLDLIYCPAGRFTMGSPNNELGRRTSSWGVETLREALIEEGFWIGKYEITQAQYKAVIGRNPSRFLGDDLPVETISWNDSVAYCQKLNEMKVAPIGYKFALPSEVQWEYACRAGTTTALNSGKNIASVTEDANMDEVAWYCFNSASQTHPVGQKKPNAWGIYDMHGNVYEWCTDWLPRYENERRVVRSGSFRDDAWECRSAVRNGDLPSAAYPVSGFRVVMEKDPTVIIPMDPVISWNTPSAITYGTPLSAAQLNATANVVGTFSYNPSYGAVLPVGTHTLSATFTPNDTQKYSSVTKTVQFTVKDNVKITPTVSWNTPPTITYGTPLSASQLNATADVWGTFSYNPSYGAVLSAGTHTLSATFTPNDTQTYSSVIKTVQLAVKDKAKITPTVSWNTPSAITYGTPLSASQLNATADVWGTFSYNPSYGAVLSAGTHTLSATFTPNDTQKYNSVTTTVRLTVKEKAKIIPTILWNIPSAITYGTPLSAAQLNATANVAGTFSYNPSYGAVLPVGTHTLSVTFTPNDTQKYSSVTKTVQLTVKEKAKITPTVSWNTPTAIIYGTPLSAAQLNATANVVGTFTYNPSYGAVLLAGTHTLRVTFTPNDTQKYSSVTKTVQFTVKYNVKTIPTISWNAPSAITYGTPLSAAQLNATADVVGTFTYNPSYGAVLPVGTHTLSVTFTPNDTIQYECVSKSVPITVTQDSSGEIRMAGDVWKIVLANNVNLEMIYCPAGSFLMGSPNTEKARSDIPYREEQHRVTLSQGFYLGKYEVTQKQYQAIMGVNPSMSNRGNNYPVDSICPTDAIVFCEKLNAAGKAPAGYEFALPTEAQWEYACRAGTTSTLYSGESIQRLYDRDGNVDVLAWYAYNSGEKTHEVGGKQENSWGFYDMYGNVAEWVSDWYDVYPTEAVTDPTGPATGTRNVCRGGCMCSYTANVRSAARLDYDVQTQGAKNYFGFRVALVPISDSFAEKKAGEMQTLTINGNVKMEMIYCPAGFFLMGSPNTEKARSDIPYREEQHRVTLSRGFYLGKYEVTQKQYQAIMGVNPSMSNRGNNYPVDSICPTDAIAFCEKLNAAGKAPAGYEFALPTEAQWEYACRAGTTSTLYSGESIQRLYDRDGNVDVLAWYAYNSGEKTHEVGGKQENPWGFYDMYGNVAEWVSDWYDVYPTEAVTDPTGPATGTRNVCRGGYMCSYTANVRSAARLDYDVQTQGAKNYFGFRVALVPVE